MIALLFDGPDLPIQKKIARYQGQFFFLYQQKGAAYFTNLCLIQYTKFTRLKFFNGFLNFFLRVHYKRTITCDGFVDRLTA